MKKKNNLYDTDFGDYDFQAELKKNPELAEVKPVGKEKVTKPSSIIDEMLTEQEEYLRKLNDSIYNALHSMVMVICEKHNKKIYVVRTSDNISSACDMIKSILTLDKVAFTKNSYAGVPKDSMFTGQYNKNTIFFSNRENMIGYHSRFAEQIKEASTKAESYSNSFAMKLDDLVYIADDLLAWEEVVLANMIYGNATTKYMCAYYNAHVGLILEKLEEYKNLLQDNL